VVVSIERLLHPRPVDGTTMVVVAGVAVVVNLAAAMVLWDDSNDLNMRAAVLHMAGDTAASACVVVAGVVIAVAGSGWDRIDPVASLVVAALIVAEAIRLSKASVDVLLESTPGDLSLDDLRQAITATPGVGGLHDLHVWSLSSDVRALSAHLVLTGHPTLEEAQLVGTRVRREIEGPFEIAHSTFELECEQCVDEEEDPCRIDELTTRQLVTKPGRDVTPSNRSAEASRAPRGHAHR
jgi:cobalt-zinc-cadmium efflux system protein